MANYNSELTGAQIESALTAINGVASNANNGKILCVNNGIITAKSAIEIQGGTIDALTITENGTYTHTVLGGYSPITVNVPTEAVTETLSVTANGSYTPSLGVDGFNQVSVNVPTPVETIAVTANGVYTPRSGIEGFSQVSVNVSGGATNVYALAKVSYVTGQVCTCTNGVFTLTSPDTSGFCFFALPSTGQWTFSCAEYNVQKTVSQYDIIDVGVGVLQELKSDCLLTTYTRLSNAVGDSMMCGGRGFTRNTSEPIIMCPILTSYRGYAVFSKINSIDVSIVGMGNLTSFSPYTPSGGNQIYVAVMQYMWGYDTNLYATTDSVEANLIYSDAAWNGSSFTGTHASDLEDIVRRFSLS